STGPGPPGWIRVRGRGVRLSLRRRQGDHGLALQWVPLLSAQRRERRCGMKRHRTPAPATLQPIRCAVYTRKSSEEGLEQEFNSLDAQRESGEAYVRSQTGEGWTLLPDRYDDGGFTGGNMDRPALKRLMADIASGKIDVVVVYKVDRLSRS